MLNIPSPQLPYENFNQASHDVLRYLHQTLGFGLWMMTRTDGDDWVVLQAEDHGYNVKDGQVFRWADSFCSHMVKGEGPKVAPKANDVEAYRLAPIGQQVPIGSYIGVPIYNADGGLFGTLCAIDPNPQSPSIAEQLALVELCGQLLSTILHQELRAYEVERKYLQLVDDASKDSMTGALNRRGWQQVLDQEQQRIQHFASSLAILVIDIDDLKTVNDQSGHQQGDLYICQVADALTALKREKDVLARIGGDEFVILAIDCNQSGAQAMTNKIKQGFIEHNLHASIGFATHKRGDSIEQTVHYADQAMYREKSAKNMVD